MYIVAFFTNAGIPVTGLTPKITIWKVSDNSVLINAQNMTEINGGWYKYDYAAYDQTIDIVAICDGTVALGDTDRYKFAGNEDSYDKYINAIKNDLDNPAQYQADVSGLAPAGEYDTALSTMQSDITFLKDVAGGGWKIIGTQLVLYKADNSTEIARYNLFDKNGVPAFKYVFDKRRI